MSDIEIECFHDGDGELLAIIAHGHLDKRAFRQAVRDDRVAQEFRHDRRREFELSEVVHAYMRNKQDLLMGDDDRPWYRATKDEPGAIPITCIPGDSF